MASRPGLPSLAIVNMGGDVRRPQFWALASDAADAAFVHQIAVQLDPAEARWVTARALSRLAACRARSWYWGWPTPPATRSSPSSRTTVRPTRCASIADAVHDASSGLLDTRAAGADRALLLYHTGELRLRAEVYVREYDHILVFSPPHPQGLEVLKLGLDDGNVVDWLVAGKTLWLHTQDRRNEKQPGNFFWSLDLSAVL